MRRIKRRAWINGKVSLGTRRRSKGASAEITGMPSCFACPPCATRGQEGSSTCRLVCQVGGHASGSRPSIPRGLSSTGGERLLPREPLRSSPLPYIDPCLDLGFNQGPKVTSASEGSNGIMISTVMSACSSPATSTCIPWSIYTGPVFVDTGAQTGRDTGDCWLGPSLTHHGLFFPNDSKTP